jgi:hypothetical protein
MTVKGSGGSPRIMTICSNHMFSNRSNRSSLRLICLIFRPGRHSPRRIACVTRE